ncbi:LacI family DNA-binding transcriptional regulator [Streptomyces sp. NBC_01716]|uniref:LacI family DNA-binding transcriptional regulator n=1 Tax=Streptomyces sp. NBC_01716 TaxID=2975917 RepID=UPI002E2FE196|nr:LacI family DNA-binding transcriptional regulator [Streptomyces sp. NBC_01716]
MRIKRRGSGAVAEWTLAPVEAPGSYELAFKLPEHIEQWISDIDGKERRRIVEIKDRFLSTITSYRMNGEGLRTYQLRYEASSLAQPSVMVTLRDIRVVLSEPVSVLLTGAQHHAFSTYTYQTTESVVPAQGRRVNQRDIARITGVSQAAVSMVVSGKADEGGIAKATQEKVRAAMRELGYVAHAAGRALRGGRNGLIGVHTFVPVFPVAVSDYYHAFLRGIEEAAVEAGHDLVLFASTQQADGSRTIYGDGTNRLRLADGAVILGLQGNDAELERLSAEGFPFDVRSGPQEERLNAFMAVGPQLECPVPS